MTKRFFLKKNLICTKDNFVKIKKKKLRQKRKGKNQNILPNLMPDGWTFLCLTFLVGNAVSQVWRLSKSLFL